LGIVISREPLTAPNIIRHGSIRLVILWASFYPQCTNITGQFNRDLWFHKFRVFGFGIWKLGFCRFQNLGGIYCLCVSFGSVHRLFGFYLVILGKIVGNKMREKLEKKTIDTFWIRIQSIRESLDWIFFCPHIKFATHRRNNSFI